MDKNCRHKTLHFENGGLHLVCSNPQCKYVYLAVGHCAGRIIQDVMARGMGLTLNDVRADPFSLQEQFQSPVKKAPKVKVAQPQVFAEEPQRPEPDPNFGKPVRMTSRKTK